MTKIVRLVAGFFIGAKLKGCGIGCERTKLWHLYDVLLLVLSTDYAIKERIHSHFGAWCGMSSRSHGSSLSNYISFSCCSVFRRFLLQPIFPPFYKPTSARSRLRLPCRSNGSGGRRLNYARFVCA